MAKILIVDDDESTQELLKFILTTAGYEVTVAGDGGAGVKAAREIRPDLMVLDVMLPEIHGYGVCHQVKADENLQKTKVLMLSAKSFPADRRQAEEAGADAFLTKPIRPKDLLDQIQKLLAAGPL